MLALCQVFLSAQIQGLALCKNLEEILVISASPRSALFEAALCKALPSVISFSDNLQSQTHLLDDEVFFYIIHFKDKVSSSKSYQSSKTIDHSNNVKRFVNEDQFNVKDEDQHQTTSNFGPYVFETLSIEANNDLANSWLHPYDRKSSKNIKTPTESPLDLRPNSKFLPVKGSIRILNMMYVLTGGPHKVRNIVPLKTPQIHAMEIINMNKNLQKNLIIASTMQIYSGAADPGRS